MREELLRTIEILSNIRTGCSADRARTSKDILKDIGGELNEVAMALGSNDIENLSEELGDLLFTVLFLIEIERDNHDIDIEKVLRKLNNKMVFRHPHVFEDKREVSIEEAESIWKERKKLEKANNIIH